MSFASTKPALNIAVLLATLAVVYAAFAGMRTVGDPDLGWQLATGRWIVQHHQIPPSDVLAYTETRPWNYPALSQIFIFLAYAAGGFTLLSWCGAVACAATTFLLGRQNAITAVLAIIAVPIVASRTSPRAEMFTEVCFAAIVAILWSYHRGAQVNLWVVPLLMLAWVNLHLGFISGLAMCAAYFLIDSFDGEVGMRSQRLRAAAPFLIAALIATAANPSGIMIYGAIVRQAKIMNIHSAWIPEWRAVRVTPLRLAEAVDVRDPNSALWWLLALAFIAVILAAWRRRFATALVLLVAAMAALSSARLKGPFATLAVIIGGTILYETLTTHPVRRLFRSVVPRVADRAAVTVALVLVTGFVSLRISDLLTQRFYFRSSYQMSVFGAGESPWFPEEATRFVASHKLPANLFNDYSVGGFVAAKLQPHGYRVYVDGRSIPFSDEHFFRSFQLLQLSPDGPEWQAESERRNINTILVSLDRDLWNGLDNLASFCHSSVWAPVYLDAYSAVFVRRTERTRDLEPSFINCDTLQFPSEMPGDRPHTRGHRFYYHLNSAAVLISLGRNDDAQQQLQRAESIGIESAYLHYAKGVIAGFSEDFKTAEIELRRALRIEPSPETAYVFAKLLESQGRLPEAEALLRRHIALADEPAPLYLELARVQLALSQPNPALASLDRAERATPFRGAAHVVGTGFFVRLHIARSQAWQQLGDRSRAIESMQQAVALAPADASLRSQLAILSGDERGTTDKLHSPTTEAAGQKPSTGRPHP